MTNAELRAKVLRLGKYVILTLDDFERLTNTSSLRLRRVSCNTCGGDGQDATWSGWCRCDRCQGTGQVYSYDRYDTGGKLDGNRKPVAL